MTPRRCQETLRYFKMRWRRAYRSTLHIGAKLGTSCSIWSINWYSNIATHTCPHLITRPSYFIQPDGEDIFKMGRSTGKLFKEKGVSLYKDKEISTTHAKVDPWVWHRTTSWSILIHRLLEHDRLKFAMVRSSWSMREAPMVLCWTGEMDCIKRNVVHDVKIKRLCTWWSQLSQYKKFPLELIFLTY